jgi:UDP-hydrolysing UDP-N-acetyl-D-glucosamine 2-epimerase
MKHKVAIVSGSRADFGLLLPVIKEMAESEKFSEEIWVTGMHLSGSFGKTLQQIEDLGLAVKEKVKCLFAGDTPAETAKAVGQGVMGFAEVFERNRPDVLIVLGDRFEILAVVQAALFFQVPVVHLCGGDVTEGAFDEAIRHSITKMSHLHFVTNEEAESRVVQMGENPDHVFNVGSPAIDLLLKMDFLGRSELQSELDIQWSKNNFLITYHPVTLTAGDVRAEMERQIDNLLEALSQFKETTFFFTKTNADSFYTPINKKIQQFCHKTDRAYFFDSLGQQRYWSLMSEVDVVIGNSSSGLYEAPSLKKATVNIGNRQKGRILASSVVQCEPEINSVFQAIQKAIGLDASDVVNPYGQGGSSQKIREELEKIDNFSQLIQKHFFDR